MIINKRYYILDWKLYILNLVCVVCRTYLHNIILILGLGREFIQILSPSGIWLPYGLLGTVFENLHSGRILHFICLGRTTKYHHPDTVRQVPNSHTCFAIHEWFVRLEWIGIFRH